MGGMEKLVKTREALCVSNATKYNAPWMEALKQVTEGEKDEDMAEECKCRNDSGERIDGHIWEWVNDQPSIEGWVMEARPQNQRVKLVREEMERLGLKEALEENWYKKLVKSLGIIYRKKECDGWYWGKLKKWKKAN